MIDSAKGNSMTDCSHQTTVKLTGGRGKTKSFCAECLWEIRDEKPREEPSAAFAAAGPDEPYTQPAVMLLQAGPLTEWEQEFIGSLGKMRKITPRQQNAWNKIVRKYFPKGIDDSGQVKPEWNPDETPF